ncbi:hypothetical protein MBLNU230_g2086t1 [Neophaeotheca triangularis]
MPQQTSGRKRAAPGALPMPPQPATQPAYQFSGNNNSSSLPQDNTDFSNYDFSTAFPSDQTFLDSLQSLTAGDSNEQPVNQNGSQAATYGSNVLTTRPSTDLVPRSRNHQLAVPQNGQQEQWQRSSTSDNSNMAGRTEEEDEQDLDMKVALAKRDAQGKRKQIPPFVQKLSSFLDSNNTDLIRWSDDGRSFIVIDEDEFARTLIPELFKHNNYASFVRQLNMYGFHKTVNITDGSLRQSEKARKGVKPPSMYSHRYFRRNRPDLLWLIQKPAGKTTAKRKRDGTSHAESDEERPFSPAPEGRPQEIGMPGSGSNDVAALPRNDLAGVRSELKTLQAQQRYISHMITQLKEQNDQFYRQATAFQALHDRHENSINAILTFLATFYNRSMDSHTGPNLVNMFGNSQKQQQQQQHGSVVEDFTDASPEQNQQMQRYTKKPPLLLTASENQQNAQQESAAVTHPPSARSSASPTKDPRSSSQPGGNLQPDSGNVRKSNAVSPQIKDDAPTPDMLNQVPESNEMMSLINSANATAANTPNAQGVDFSSALDHFQNANGNNPLTPQQRDNVLNMINNSQNNGKSNNNALVSPDPPAMPNLDQIKQTQQQLEVLSNMQKRQDDRVQELNRRLQPLSPTGAIPGLAEGSAGGEGTTYFDNTGTPGAYDPAAFLNFDDNNFGANDGSDINFDFGTADNGDGIDWDFSNAGNDLNASDMFQTGGEAGTGGYLSPQTMNEGGRVESVSSSATSPAIPGEGDGGGGDAEAARQSKRQRKS